MYKFIIGGSGSGKSNKAFTDCIAAAMAAESSHFLLITPEQSTTWAEKEIVRLHPHHATDNIDVVSFSRLAHRVFEELGIVNPQVINDIEKAMILRRIGYAHKDELKIWGSRFDKPGFVDNLKSMISELYQYGLGPDDIRIDEGFGSRLNNKLCDLKLIYSEFRREIADRYTTAEEIPDILARNIYRSEMIKNSVIILDGFTGFTPIQYRIIEGFLCYAKEVIVTVSIGRDMDNPLFDMSREMIRRITELGDKNSVMRGKDTVLTTDNFIENHILRYDGAVCHDAAPRVVRAQNMKEEAEFICSRIESLVKREGLRYRDIAVVCSDQEAYARLLAHQMEVSGIPSYMDETIGMSDNALVMMITAALDVISSDYSYESFIRYLKSGLPEENEEKVFILDNYIYECGRRGYKRMAGEWDYMPADLADVEREDINRFKNDALAPLEPLHEIFTAKKAPVAKIVDTINELMDSCNVQQKLDAMREEFAAEKDRYREREYAEAYENVAGILSDMKDLLKNEEMGADEFSQIFTAGIDQVKLGVLPSGADRVVIGDITRSRIEDVKVLFVAGANEGLLPKLLNRKNVITDTEKEKLKTAGYELAPTAREDLLIQRYYIYRIFSKPTQQLILTYSGIDAGGAALRPSYITVHLMKLYPDIRAEEASGNIEVLNMNAAVSRIGEALRDMRVATAGKETEDMHAATGKDTADIHTAAGKEATTDEDRRAFESLYAYLREKDDERTALITDAALYSYKPQKLSKESIDLLYGEVLYGSVSKLEMFAKCPYQFFARYGLGLREIEEFTFRAMDIGNIAHAALEKIFVKAKKDALDLKSLSEDEKNAMVASAISQAILDDEEAKYKDSAHNEYMVKRVERVVRRSLWGLLEKLDDGYRPYEMEWPFSSKDHLSSTKLVLDDKRVMELSGKIDRTDIDESDPSKVGVRVIDYKSGNKTWDLNDVINGNDLQITMYMAAVQELLEHRFKGREISPEQMYYYTVQDPIVDLDKLSAKKTVEEELKNQMALAGVDDKEHIEELIPYVRGKAEGIGRSIVSGDIKIAPKCKDSNYTSCTYCDYRSVCGFDRKIDGFGMKTDRKYPKEEQWQIISGQKNS